MRALLPRCALAAATLLTATLVAPLAASASEADVEQAKAEVAAAGRGRRRGLRGVRGGRGSPGVLPGPGRGRRGARRQPGHRHRADGGRALRASPWRHLSGVASTRSLTALSGCADYAEGTETLTASRSVRPSRSPTSRRPRSSWSAPQATASASCRRSRLSRRIWPSVATRSRPSSTDAKDELAVVEAENQARLAAEEARRLEEASRSGDAADAAEDPATDPPAGSGVGQMMLPVSGRVSSPFGYRVHPIYGTRKLHKGIDLATGCGTPVVAAQDGVVESAKWTGSYGNSSSCSTAGAHRTAYAHLQGFVVTSGPVSKGADHRLRRDHGAVHRLPPALRGPRGRRARRPDGLPVDRPAADGPGATTTLLVGAARPSSSRPLDRRPARPSVRLTVRPNGYPTSGAGARFPAPGAGAVGHARRGVEQQEAAGDRPGGRHGGPHRQGGRHQPGGR